jgi:rhodanese-related sulfurtransferase
MNPTSPTIISAADLKQSLDDGKAIRLVDVRTPAEFESVHIDGAESRPLDRFVPDDVKNAGQEDGACVLICRSGARAAKASKMLADAGCQNIRILDGGVMAWEAAGYPVIRGSFILPLERQVRIAAGLLVVIGVVLGWLVNPAFYGLSGFVGCGLIMAGITDWCPMASLIAMMPWNQRGGASCCGGGGCGGG